LRGEEASVDGEVKP